MECVYELGRYLCYFLHFLSFSLRLLYFYCILKQFHCRNYIFTAFSNGFTSRIVISASILESLTAVFAILTLRQRNFPAWMVVFTDGIHRFTSCSDSLTLLSMNFTSRISNPTSRAEILTSSIINLTNRISDFTSSKEILTSSIINFTGSICVLTSVI